MSLTSFLLSYRHLALFSIQRHSKVFEVNYKQTSPTGAPEKFPKPNFTRTNNIASNGSDLTLNIKEAKNPKIPTAGNGLKTSLHDRLCNNRFTSSDNSFQTIYEVPDTGWNFEWVWKLNLIESYILKLDFPSSERRVKRRKSSWPTFLRHHQTRRSSYQKLKTIWSRRKHKLQNSNQKNFNSAMSWRENTKSLPVDKCWISKTPKEIQSVIETPMEVRTPGKILFRLQGNSIKIVLNERKLSHFKL